MAKRGNAWIGVVANQDQWRNCLAKPGLSLFDIYSACWGPCLAIQPTFKQLQMEFGDELSIMLAETDKIEELIQFRGTSQPLFLLYCKGVPIAILKGANQPKLLDLVRRCSKEQKENKKLVNILQDATPEEEALAHTMSRSSAHSWSSATQLSDFTLALIKPDAVRARFVGDIIDELNENGLMVMSQQVHTMTAEEVQQFYPDLVNEPFFLNLVEYMTSGPSVALVLAKVNPSDNRPVCSILKQLRGPKDVVCAKQEQPSSLRAKFAVKTDSGVENAIHSSDDGDATSKELAFFFPNFQNEAAGLERTLCIIRPDTNKQYKENILAKLEELDFKIALQREVVVTRVMAETFYAKHRDEPFFEALVAQMTCGPSLVLALCSKDAVRRWRSYLGPTLVSDARETAPESMRATFTTDDTINGLHGSSNPEEAAEELNFFFPTEQTVAVIKPDMMEKKEEIVSRIQEAGIVIQAQKSITLNRDEAGNFYDEHKNKEFYGDLCNYMASGESSFLVLSANNAVEKWREIMGPTDPNEAKENKPQSLRSKLGTDILKNGLHGSSTVDHALKSIELIFGASMTIRSTMSKTLSNSYASKHERHNTSDGVAEIGSDVGGTDKTENDACSSLPADTPRGTGGNGSQRTLDGQEELPQDSQHDSSQPPTDSSQPHNDSSQPHDEESQNNASVIPAEENKEKEDATLEDNKTPVPPEGGEQEDTIEEQAGEKEGEAKGEEAQEEESPKETTENEEVQNTETGGGQEEKAQDQSDENKAEETPGEESPKEESSKEESAKEETHPPQEATENEEHAVQEPTDVVQTSMTNLSEGLSPISEGQEDYFQDSFNSDSSALREARETTENEMTMTPEQYQTGDELEELPADSEQEGTPVPGK